MIDPSGAPQDERARVPMADLARLHAPLQGALERAVVRVVRSGRYVGGPELEAFEAELAAWTGRRHVVGTSSGTDALTASLIALGVGPGDEVVTTPFSFVSAAEAVARLGATPLFADIDPGTYNLDPDALARAITPRTRAVIPVHLFGLMCDMRRIHAVCRPRSIPVIEDAAQAIGAERDGLTPGSGSLSACLSFFPTKNLGALGDGGAVLSDDDAFAAEIRRIGRHGASSRYRYERLGANFRLDALQAAALRVKLGALKEWTEARRRIAARYDEALAGHPSIEAPRTPPGARHAFHHYVVRARERDALAAHLDAAGVEVAIYYPSSLADQACFAPWRARSAPCPETERACRELLAVPVWPGLRDQEIARIARALTTF